MNIDGEIISAMIYSAQCARRGCVECEAADFIDADCKRIFQTMVTMDAAGTAIDLVTLCDMFEPEYTATIAQIGSLFVTDTNFGTWIGLIKQRRKFREFRNEMTTCLQMAQDESPDVFDKASDALARIQAIGGGGIERVGQDALQAVIEIGNKTSAIPTGYSDLDKIVGGFYAGNLIIVAGRPSMGKSSLAINFATNLCRQGRTVAVFTMEDSKASVARRMALGMSRVSVKEVRNGDTKKCAELMEAAQRIANFKLFVNERGQQTAQSILSDCYKIKAKERELDLVIVDYLGLIKTKERTNGTRQQEIGEVTRSMKILAKELNTTVILISQLNRSVETRENKKPMMSDLRESGAIEQDADVIIFPYRPFVYMSDAKKNDMSTTERQIAEREAWLIVAKNRNGIVGDLRVVWVGEHYRFMDIAQ